MNVYVSIVMSAIILVIVPSAAFGVAMAAKRNHSGAEPSNASLGLGDWSGSLSYPSGTDPQVIATCLDNWLKKKMPNSPLVGQGISYAKAGQANNINPAFMLAVAGQESTFGTAYKGLENYEQYNIQNMKCAAAHKIDPGLPCQTIKGFEWGVYSSWDHSINSWAKYLKQEYFDQGKTTIETIQKKYCPDSDGDCATTWQPGVKSYFKQITSACPILNVSTTIAGGNGDVVLDPGHGGDDADRGFIGDKTEAGNNFDIAMRVKNIIESKGIKVVMTKADVAANPTLPDRVKVANASNASVFVSLHSNAQGGVGPIGIVYCAGPANGKVDYQPDSCAATQIGQQSRQLSKNIVNNITSSLGLTNPRFWGGDLGALTGLRMPGTLVEMFAHDQQSDIAKVSGKEDQLANAIASGIMSSLGK